MIDDETAPEMIAAAKEIGQRLAQLMAGREYTKSIAQQLSQALYDHRVRCRATGLAFPPMTVMAAPRIGAVAFYRADLDPIGIRGAVLQFIRIHPQLTLDEAAVAVRTAWPHVRPGDLVDEGAVIVAKDKARARQTEAA